MPLKEDAIPDKDVSNEQPETELSKKEDKEQRNRAFNADRQAMMELIAERANQQFAGSSKDDEEVSPEPEVSPDDETPKSDETPNALEPPKEEAPATPAPPQPPTEKMVTIVVDGVTKEVPESQIIDTGRRAMQKELASDKRLEEAARLKKEVEELKAELYRRMPPGQDPGAHIQQPQQTPPPDPLADVATKIPSWMTAIRYGTEEEANAAFMEALRATQSKVQQPPQPSELEPSKVLRMVDERLQVKSIVTKFDQTPPEQGGFADIAKDPYLRQLATEEVNRLIRDENRHPLDWETYELAGKKIREWRDALIPKQPEQPTSTVQPKPDDAFKEKIEKKSTIDKVPTANVRTITGDKPPVKEETPKDVIAEMHRQRARLQQSGG